MLEALNTLIQYKTLLSWIAGLILGGGVLGAIGYALNKRDDRLIQQGGDSVNKKLSDDKIQNLVADKEARDSIEKKTMPEVDYFNAYNEWPDVPTLNYYKSNGVWPPRKT